MYRLCLSFNENKPEHMLVYDELKNSTKKTDKVVKAVLNSKKTVLNFDEANEEAVLTAHKLSMLGSNMERFLIEILADYSLADIKDYIKERGDGHLLADASAKSKKEIKAEIQNIEKEVVEEKEADEEEKQKEDLEFVAGLKMFF